MYEVVIGLLEKLHWMPLNQVALATDGASSMTGHRMEQATRRCAKVSILMNVHYIAHREALPAGDATRVFLEFQMLNRFGNKVHELMGRSTNRCNELKRLLKDVFEEDYVAVLQIHAICWFSQGNVMTHLPQCMPTVFKLLRDCCQNDSTLLHIYASSNAIMSRIGMRSFSFLSFHFYLNLFADSLHEFNMIWLMSQLLVQSSISLLQFYHFILNPGMDLCLIVQRIWKNS